MYNLCFVDSNGVTLVEEGLFRRSKCVFSSQVTKKNEVCRAVLMKTQDIWYGMPYTWVYNVVTGVPEEP